MKKMFLCLLIFFMPFQQPIQNDFLPLDLIAEATMEQGLSLQSWQVIMDEKISRKKFEELLNKLENEYLVTILNEGNTLKYIMEYKNEDELINHSFQAIVPNSNDDQITLKLDITGTEWNDETKEIYHRLTNVLQFDYNINFGRIFTCLKLSDDGIIKVGSNYESILNSLNVTHINEQYDNVQNSTYAVEYYGYTQLWDEEISVLDKKINFQMIVKENANNNKEIIIGTPIVINEY